MQNFIIRAVKSQPHDILRLQPDNGYVFFFCKGLKDLQKTIRHITPRGYRVRTSTWFSKWLKINNYDLVLKSGFLVKKETYRILKIDQTPNDFKTVDFVNRENKTYSLKCFVTEASVLKISELFN